MISEDWSDSDINFSAFAMPYKLDSQKLKLSDDTADAISLNAVTANSG